MKFISLFAGIGGFDLALIRQGHECVWANEWDKYAAQIYDKNFKTKIDQRDIRTIKTSEIPSHELLVGGFPCQAFSIAGKRKGFDDTRGTLFFEIARILREKKPRLFILENVKGLLSHDNGNTFKTIISTLDELGYDLQWQVLNSKNFGVPQNRERVFIIGNIRGTSRPQIFPIGQDGGFFDSEHKKRFQWEIQTNGYKRQQSDSNSEILETGENRPIHQLNQPTHSNNRIYGDDGISPALNTMQGGNRQPFVALTERRTEEAKRLRRLGIVKDTRNLKKLEPREDGIANTVTTGDIKNSSLTNGSKIRRLTPIECERLQGFPDNWTVGVSDTQRYKMCGNAVTVNVISYLVSKL